MNKNEEITSKKTEKWINNKNILDNKTIGNSISAYLMLFVSWLFLLNKTNKNINNSFVHSHTKSALLIHLWFLVTYIIFVSNSLFSNISYMWLWLNHILANIIFIWLLFLLIFWIYKAKKWLTFNISEKINISKKESYLDINWDWNITEKEKLTVLLSFIPLVWFINYWKYKENLVIQEAVRINILISLSIALLYIFWHENLANLTSLIYIILITFVWVNLFTRNELIQIKLPSFFSPERLYLTIKSIKIYLTKYFKDDNFSQFSILIEKKSEEYKKEELENQKKINLKKEIKLPKFLIYIPFINLIFIFFKDSKYRFHIINGLVLTAIIILLIWLSFIMYINTKLYLLFLFPILFWIWYLSNRLAYKMPLIYDIYELVTKIILLFIFSSKEIKKKSNEVNEVSLKVNK